MWAFRQSGINSRDLPSILIPLCQVEHDLHAVSKQDIQSALALALVSALCSPFTCRNSLEIPFQHFGVYFQVIGNSFLDTILTEISTIPVLAPCQACEGDVCVYS
jgi:hypothetical protein